MLREVPVSEAVGMVLCHDLTRIVPGSEKGRAFRKGHVVREEDIPKLLDMGKKHVYVWEFDPEMVHEDEAALRLAGCAAGEGLKWAEPNQGKVSLKASTDGLLKINDRVLKMINGLDGVIMSTLHGNRVVAAGQTVAGTRAIPLSIPGKVLEQAEAICRQHGPLIWVKSFQPRWFGVVTTGSEVYEGRIQDGFCSVLKKKLVPLGGRFLGQVIVPDDPSVISMEIRRLVSEGAELVMVTGGMSVDPDDVTPAGIRAAGAQEVFYGAPVLPGSMFMLAYLGHVPVCGLPGCVMFNRTTILDLILPRIFAGEMVTRDEVVSLGHGGLCEECEVCRFPACSFGKTL
jgi:molybdopterin biosynthesis enzyme